jgi:hypothetical protein
VEFVMSAQPIRSAPKAAVKPRLTSRRRDAPQTAELLCDRHGEAKARKLVEREQKHARQARSRKQFTFWAAVMREIELRREIAPDHRGAEEMGFAGQGSGEVAVSEILEGKASE